MTATTQTQVDARAVAMRIAHRMSQIGWVEDNDIFKALSDELLPAVELLVDGVRYLVNVEAVPSRYQLPDPASVRADGSVEQVLF